MIVFEYLLLIFLLNYWASFLAMRRIFWARSLFARSSSIRRSFFARSSSFRRSFFARSSSFRRSLFARSSSFRRSFFARSSSISSFNFRVSYSYIISLTILSFNYCLYRSTCISSFKSTYCQLAWIIIKKSVWLITATMPPPTNIA